MVTETQTDQTQESVEQSSVNVSTEQSSTTQENRGRPLSQEGQKAKQAINDYLDTVTESFTPNDVTNATGASAVAVRNRLNALKRQGTIEKVGTRAGEGRGRPQAVYQVKGS